MKGVLNEVTNTVHKQETGKPGIQTICGVAYHTPEDNLRPVNGVDIERGTANASKCGRCFDEGGSY
jgi:hypothetical protein